jgi:hypothetical protein
VAGGEEGERRGGHLTEYGWTKCGTWNKSSLFRHTHIKEAAGGNTGLVIQESGRGNLREHLEPRLRPAGGRDSKSDVVEVQQSLFKQCLALELGEPGFRLLQAHVAKNLL